MYEGMVCPAVIVSALDASGKDCPTYDAAYDDDDVSPTGEMKPEMVIPITPGAVPTVPAYAGELRTTCDVLENCASVPLWPFQSPLTLSMVPLLFTCVTIATWSATPPPA